MKLADETIRKLAAKKGLSLSELLFRSGVSRTAYYSLTRRATVLPKSVHALAYALEVRPRDIVEQGQNAAEDRAVAHMREVRKIQMQHPTSSFDNLWHTICLLELPPEERLNRSLTRGRTGTIHG